MTEADAFLNGVPYLQTISDITTGHPIGIHVEPGLWTRSRTGRRWTQTGRPPVEGQYAGCIIGGCGNPT